MLKCLLRSFRSCVDIVPLMFRISIKVMFFFVGLIVVMESICRHWQAGRCWAGQGCRFAHPPSEEEEQRYEEMREMVRAACRFAAEAAAVPAVLPPGTTLPPTAVPPPPAVLAKARPLVVKPAMVKSLLPQQPSEMPPAAAGWNPYLMEEGRAAEAPKEKAVPKTAAKPWTAPWLKKKAAPVPARRTLWDAVRDKHLADLAAEEEAARRARVPHTPPRKKRRKLQPTPKWKAGSMAALISASEGTGDVFEDVQTAAEAEAAADDCAGVSAAQMIDEYLAEEQ